MRIKHLCRSHSSTTLIVYITHHASNARERDLQFFRFWGKRGKQSALRATSLGRPGYDTYSFYRCARTMLCKIELKQFEQNLSVLHRDWKLERALKYGRFWFRQISRQIAI